MWPFKKKQPDPIDITPQVFRAWVDAQRPPLEWFLSLSEIEQFALADLGADYVADCAKAFAAAWVDEVADRGAEAITDEEALAQIGQNAAAEVSRGTPTLTAHDLAAALERREAKTNGPETFMGKPKEVAPDE